jgi:hypothetical protein
MAKGKILRRCVEMWDTFNGILDQGVSRNPDIDEDFMHTDLQVFNPMFVERANWSLARTNNIKSFFFCLRFRRP